MMSVVEAVLENVVQQGIKAIGALIVGGAIGTAGIASSGSFSGGSSVNHNAGEALGQIAGNIAGGKVADACGSSGGSGDRAVSGLLAYAGGQMGKRLHEKLCKEKE